MTVNWAKTQGFGKLGCESDRFISRDTSLLDLDSDLRANLPTRHAEATYLTGAAV
jgi:hypothetical protein